MVQNSGLSAMLNVSFHPGSNQLWMDIQGKTEVLLFEEKSDIKCNGCSITPEELVKWLLNNKAVVTLHPRIDRYGASTQAEFVQKN